ncbi:MAG TPA: hypothetical protein VFR47_00475 [Anaerolineales bacterium]|nr:hypothetical protein [Anaerolineales bacterium]
MLSKYSRWLMYLNAILYAILGILLFIFPEQLAPVFAWKVTAFMTMTIGGWCLGNAWLAWWTARVWKWNRIFSAALYLWLFGVGELLVLWDFRDRLKLEHPIAWLYLVTLIVTSLSAILGIFELLRARLSNTSSSPSLSPWQRLVVIAFIIFVGFLGFYGLMAEIGDVGTNAGIFPEIMSLFTLRSFGIFYFCIALAVLPYLWNPNLEALYHHSIASYGLIVFITLAALVYIRLFDFAVRPGGLLYFAAYLGVGIPLLFVFRKYGLSH